MAKDKKKAQRAKNGPKRDLYQEITDTIIKTIEKNPGSPQMPWRKQGGTLFMPVNARTKAGYNGINILSLWCHAEDAGFSTNIWGTYRQWQDMDCQVRKSKKSSTVIFYKEFEVDPDPEQKDDDGKRRVLRGSSVFNACQVDGFELPEPPQSLGPIERIETCDSFIKSTKAKICHGGDRAFYRSSSDHIQMPDEGLFEGTDTMTRNEGYYAVLLHELTHWSGNKSRCDRDLANRFGSAKYAAEELVAEIGSAFLCSELSITHDTRADHAQYVANWLQLLKDDDHAIFTAAAKAQEAVNFLKSLQSAKHEVGAYCPSRAGR